MSLSLLLELRDLAEQHGRAELRDWTCRSVDLYLSSPQADLCRCMGLRAPGVRSPSTIHRKRRRDRYLRFAALLLLPDGTDRQRAKALHAEIVLFRRAWPRIQRTGRIPDGAPPSWAELAGAFAVGMLVPGTVAGLVAVVRDCP